MRKKKKPSGFESYEVKFWVQKENGYWEQRLKTYHGYCSKSAHKQVRHDCIKEYGREIKIVSISYQ